MVSGMGHMEALFFLALEERSQISSPCYPQSIWEPADMHWAGNLSLEILMAVACHVIMDDMTWVVFPGRISDPNKQIGCLSFSSVHPKCHLCVLWIHSYLNETHQEVWQWFLAYLLRCHHDQKLIRTDQTCGDCYLQTEKWEKWFLWLLWSPHQKELMLSKYVIAQQFSFSYLHAVD